MKGNYYMADEEAAVSQPTTIVRNFNYEFYESIIKTLLRINTMAEMPASKFIKTSKAS